MKRGSFLVFLIILLLIVSPLASAGITGSTITGSATDDEEALPPTNEDYSPPKGKNHDESYDKSLSIEKNHEYYEKDFEEKYETYEGDKEFNVDPGTKPGDFFYFLDNAFERPGNNPEKALSYKEEKIAEAIVMVKEGKPIEAAMVLEKALEYSEIIEEEVTPELEERVEESSIQVQNVLKEIEKEVTGDEWVEVQEKFDNQFEKEGKLRTAAEVAAKINELCAELARLDPIQYEDTCKVSDEGPKWMRDKHKKWSKEQEKEAKEFGKIMKECMGTSGKDCRCEEIPFYEFSVFCEKMSDLAVECNEGKGDENACMEMEDIEMPELPEHLAYVFDKIEREFGESKFENHMPKECVEAGANNPKECMLIMIEFNSPPECKTALREAAKKGEIRGERDGKKLCDEIMFKEHTPKECIDAGARTAEECAKIMFKGKMPQKCIDAGFDGTHKGDEKECKEMMKKGDHYGGGKCLGIGNFEERLKCLEGAMRVMQDRYGMEESRFGGEMTWQCKENRIFNPEDCKRFMRDVWPQMEQQNQRKWEVERKEREVYHDYKMKGGQLCPDGICDYAEQNGMAYCPEDCGNIYGEMQQQCGPGCWWEGDHCECENMGVDCGYGCWWDSGLNRCECSEPVGGQDCGYGCWWVEQGAGGYCECSHMDEPHYDCGYGCWWEPSMNSCKCSPTVNTQITQGCMCSWGWSDNCDCGVSTKGGYCGDGICEGNEYCPEDCGTEDVSGCQCYDSYGKPTYWDSYCNCPATSDRTQTCASMGGTCCNVCADDSYISGTECNCCGSCETNSGGGDMSCTTWVSGTGTSCNPASGICCSDGYCSNMNGPGTCEGSSEGDYIQCYSDSDCSSGEVCRDAGTERSWCDATSGGGDTGCDPGEPAGGCGEGCSWDESSCMCDCPDFGCDCPDGSWSDNCDCSGHDSPITGEVIFWNYWND